MKYRTTMILILLSLATFLAAQDTGGPDTFGYTYANSNAASGPDYAWITPAGTNQITDLLDDNVVGPIPIGFDFPFYDGLYSQFWLSSNGWLRFNQGAGSYLSNDPIPDTSLPNDIIAWMWMDLDPGDNPGGNTYIYYENLPDDNSFLISFIEYHDYPGSSNGWVTAQMRLYPNGDILLQYDHFENFDLDESTVGIENIDGTDGLEYAYENSAQLSDQLAVKFTYPVSATDDLSAEGIAGNIAPSVGQATTYTVTIRNRGSEVQDTYMVKLWEEEDIMVDEVVGTTIQPGEILDFNLTWTPGAEGPTYLWGEVVFESDEVPDNNVTENLAITVIPAGTTVVQIGDGTENNYQVPFNFFYKNSLGETLYFPNEINLSGDIFGITWFNTFSTNLPNMPVNIWMGHTTLTDLSAGFVPAGDLTQVFTGNADFPAGENEIFIPFDAPFSYNGTDNLIILTERVMDTQYYSTSDRFFLTQSPEHPARSIEQESDSTDLDPFAPPDPDTPHDYFPNIQLWFSGGITGVGGYVSNSQTTPIVGALVEVVQTGDTFTTGDNGYYSFELPAGTYTLTASADGYLPETVDSVEVIDGEMTDLSFTLGEVVTVTVEVDCNDGGSPDNAAVSLSDDENTFNGEVGAAGSIYFDNVPAGTYDLTVYLSGYDTYEELDIVISTDVTLPVMLIESLLPPADLACDDTGLFTWAVPVVPATRRSDNARRAVPDSRSLIGFIVYLDGVEVTTTTDLTYLFTGLVDQQTYTAGVVADYTTGPSEMATVEFTFIAHDNDEPDINPFVNAWLGNYPNPFNPTTTLHFSLAEPQAVCIDIYNTRGRKVRTLVNDTRAAGTHTVTWNGDDDAGHQMASGIYVGRLQATAYTHVFKMIMMK
ncbi:MAG: carboxypeptidase regulatory-like domain-containing protein [Candidatus Cloacimonetes bacterium]|nr:carboxypeptidase regulatory-like domain-containing protein [Candidatus Cloacimonadota bacterium]